MCKKEKKSVILIAEDNPSNYRLLEVLLGSDYELVHAWNGVEVIDLFLKIKPDLVLMDIKMPMKNGDEAMLELKNISPSTPIIAVTAVSFEGDINMLLNMGFNDCVIKPISIKLMIEAVNKWL